MTSGTGAGRRYSFSGATGGNDASDCMIVSRTSPPIATTKMSLIAFIARTGNI